MRHGSLLNYLRRHEATLGANVGLLLDMCIQVNSKFLNDILNDFSIIIIVAVIEIFSITGLQRHGLFGKA